MFSKLKSRIRTHLTGGFTTETRGAIAVELVIVLPLLLWALAATVVFFDGFRTRYMSQVAVQTVADAMSRETAVFTPAYIEGMNAVFDHLATNGTDTRLRISSVRWNATTSTYELAWSYGSRGLSPLPNNTFALLAANDHAGLQALFGNDTSASFANASLQMPVPDLATRIPPVLNGEALLVVESFSIWTPFAAVGLGQMRLQNVVTVRSRFASQQVFDADPSANNPPAGGSAPAAPESPAPVDPTTVLAAPTPLLTSTAPTGTTTVLTKDFETSPPRLDPTSPTVTQGPTGSFMGPLTRSTQERPVWPIPVVNLDLTGRNAYVQIDLDLLIFDRWDGYNPGASSNVGDTIIFRINGHAISVDAFHADMRGHYGNPRSTLNYIGGALVSVKIENIESGRQLGGSRDSDQRWRVTITGQNMPENLNLTVASGIDEDATNESYGIDNISVKASGSATVTATRPIDYTTAIRTDPVSQMSLFAGCPDVRYPVQWVTMTRDNMRADHSAPRYPSIPRQAGGTTNLNSCPNVPGDTYVSANASLMLNYDNQGQSNQAIVIHANDGSNGSVCNASLLIRDPNGQWWFNNDQGVAGNSNPALTFRNAPSGLYTIYVGNAAAAHCITRVYFESY